MTTTGLPTDEHCYNVTSVWNNTSSLYQPHTYHSQPLYRHRYTNVDQQQQVRCDGYRATTVGRQYVRDPSASYSANSAETLPGTNTDVFCNTYDTRCYFNVR